MHRSESTTIRRTGPRLSTAAWVCACAFGLFAAPPQASAGGVVSCTPGDDVLSDTCRRVDRVAQHGSWDLYLSGYGWHIDGYSAEKRHALNAKSWGGGAGKHWTDANGNEDILFAFVFLDSHVRPEPIAGYARLWFTSPVMGGLSAGGGWFAGFTARKDVLSYIPLPIALPIASLRYRNASVMGTFIPRVPGFSNGDLAFFWARYEF